jgi:hypothetical protein
MNANQRPNVWVAKRSWISLLMFVIGATSTIDFSLVGRVTIAEMIAFAFVPYFWLTNHRNYVNANFQKSIVLLGGLFLGTIIADFINQNYFLFSARAFSRPVFMLGFLLFFIPVLVRDPLSLVYMVYGRVFAGIINYFRPSQFEAASAADASSYAGVVFRVEPLIAAIAIAIAVFIYTRSRILAMLCFMLGGATVIMFGGARSGILIWACSAAMIFVIKWLKSGNSRRIIITPSRIVGIGVVGLIALSSIYFFYIWGAPRGYLGETQEKKMVEQQNTVFGVSPLGFILAGRPQVYGAVLGILDRPILGFGSWRSDLTSAYVIEAIASVGTDPEVMDRLNSGGSAGGAGHSVLFQAWVENGLLPAIAYLGIFIITIRVFIFNIKYENRLTPYFIVTIVGFTWNFFFSPPGLGLRFSVGLFLAFYVVFMDRQRSLARMALLP